MWFICYKCNGEGYIDKKECLTCRFDITGNLPTNSGISPYLTRSSGSKLSISDEIDCTFEDVFTSAPKPIPILLVL